MGQLVPRAQLVRCVSMNWCQLDQLVPLAQFGAICPIDVNWANWFHGPNWRDMYYVCQLGQLVSRALLVRYVSMHYSQLGQLVLLAQLARYVLLMPIGPIGSIGPIAAICPIDANWANWFHWPNWRDLYYVQMVPRAQLVRYVPMNWCQLGQLVPSSQLARYVLLMPFGPIGSTGPIGAICTMYSNWANWIHGPNWCDMSHWFNANWANWFPRPSWRNMYYLCQLGQLVPRAQLVRFVPMNWCQMGQLIPSAQLVRYVSMH